VINKPAATNVREALAIPTGIGQADGMMSHQDKAKLDRAVFDRAMVLARMKSF
jgi:hypothetical protein